MKRTIIIFFTIILAACQAPEKHETPTQQKSVGTEQSKSNETLNVGFLLVNGVYNTEVMAPFDIFQHTIYHTKPGMKVFTVAETLAPIQTFEGLRILPDYTFDSDSLPHIDILVVASAEHSMDSDLDNEKMISFVSETGQKSKYVLSLCDGAFVLAKAGLVDGKESTTFPSDIPKYKEMYPQLTVHENVSFVHHDNLITSAGGAKSYDAAIYLCEVLYGEKIAQGIGRGLVIDWNLHEVQHLVVP